MSRAYKPTHYPIVIKEAHGSLILRCEDLDVTEHERIEYLSAEGLQKRITRLWGKMDLKLKEREAAGLPHPEPSTLLDTRDQMQRELPKRITTSEAARILGCSPMSVRRLEAAGVLRATVTEGGHRRFLRLAVEAYHANTSQGASPRP